MAAGGHAPGSAVVAVTIVFTIVAAVLTALRLYTRWWIVTNAGVDDVLVSLGVILSVMVTLTMCKQVQFGMGRHADTLDAHDNVESLRWFWASVWVYYLALWAVKMSILFQYLRILPENRYRWACYSLMGVVSLWTCWAFFSAVFACSPVEYFWDMSLQGTCLDRLAVWFANAGVNIVTDICTAVLPLPVLNTMRLPQRQKYILMAVFGLGGITCLISILRLQSLYVISKSNDVTWDNPLAAIWSSLEVNIGIMSACIPTLRGLLARVLPNIFGSFESAYGRTNSAAAGGSGLSRSDRVASFRGLGHQVPDVEKEVAQVQVHELSSPEQETIGLEDWRSNPIAEMAAEDGSQARKDSVSRPEAPAELGDNPARHSDTESTLSLIKPVFLAQGP